MWSNDVQSCDGLWTISISNVVMLLIILNEIIDAILTDDNLNHTKYNIIKKMARKCPMDIKINITFHILYFSLRMICMTAANALSLIGRCYFVLFFLFFPFRWTAVIYASRKNLSNFICSRAKYDLSFCSPLNDPIALTISIIEVHSFDFIFFPNVSIYMQ